MTPMRLRAGSRARTSRRRTSLAGALAVLAVTALAAGCATTPAAVGAGPAPPSLSMPEPAVSAAAASGSPVPVPTGNPVCTSGPDSGRPVLESYRPPAPMPAPGHMPAGSPMSTIYDNGKGNLVVGVDQDEYDWSYPNPDPGHSAGTAYLGFDIDLLHALSNAIFGNPDRLEFVPVAQDYRIGAANQRIVDVVADSVTINCPRAGQVMFSIDYYDAHAALLVPRDNTRITVTISKQNVPSIQGVPGGKICTVGSTTSVTSLARLAKADDFSVVLADNWSDCLALLQDGAVQAFSTDDSILDGIAAEDHYVKVLGDFSNEPHGLAFPLTAPGGQSESEFVAFANGVLLGLESHAKGGYCPEARLATESCWDALYRTWIEQPALGTGKQPTPPPPPVPSFIPG